MATRILTQHPAGKQGVNIDKARYDVIATAIIDSIRAAGVLPFKELAAQVAMRIPDDFDGAVGWYTTTVKLDLEARGMIVRVPGRTPQHLQLTAAVAPA